jgi:tRNA pseudouridine38-40 synthase
MQIRKPGHQAREQVRKKRNLRLTLAFDGTAYHGWQIQADRATIQGIVSAAIEAITGEQIKLTGSGRTDSGTHARALVANFVTTSRIPCSQMGRALNSTLPKDIRVLSVRRVEPDFHARHDARSKVYRYQIYCGPVLPPHLNREYFHYPYAIDLIKMQRAAQLFVGEHDFASFTKGSGFEARTEGTDSSPSRRPTVRRILRCELRKQGCKLHFTVEGNGFLRYMVRNMAGTILAIGCGRMSMEEFKALFSKRDRTLAGSTAPARGLVLLKVRY